MTTSIYSMNGEIAYQHGNSRAVRGASGWRHEIKRGGKWVESQRPSYIERIVQKVKAALAAA